MLNRLRRNRKNQIIRDMLAEIQLKKSMLVYPVFIKEGTNIKEEIKTLEGQYRYSLDMLLKEIPNWIKLGINHLAIFPSIENTKKDENGSEGLNENGLTAKAIITIKKEFPNLMLVSDIALDPYTSHGHDGIIKNNMVDNDLSVEVLAKMSLLHAQCGADWVAPSDMMDGRILAIRNILEKNGFINTSILAYSAKYASNLYGPFRDAVGSPLKSNTTVNSGLIDKKTYQMDYRNSSEALREAMQDIEEGADMVMVKPASLYLDIISKIKDNVLCPVAAYQVSGEYSMIKFSAKQGFFKEEDMILESITAIKRAGADVIFTYFAPEIAKFI